MMTCFKVESSGYSHIRFFKLLIFYFISTLTVDGDNASATHVPVGDDQSQHLELARVLARQFNHTFSTDHPTFVIPETMISIPFDQLAYRRLISTDNIVNGSYQENVEICPG